MRKCPGGELSRWGDVLVGNCPGREMSWWGSCNGGELSRWGIVLVLYCIVLYLFITKLFKNYKV